MRLAPPLGWLFLLATTAALAEEPPRAPVEPMAPAAPPAAMAASASVPRSRLTGRVFERGTLVPVAGAVVETKAGDSVVTDTEGRFELDVAPGAVEILVSAAGYEPLPLKEEIRPGIARTVEYRLLSQPVQKRRYRSTVHGTVSHEGERFTLREEELTQVPGAVGDPFRVIATLPGVIQPIPLMPIYVVRGGSPGMNGFFLDGMRVPQLFHLMLVDGVVHPRILDRLDFYPGSYDASFGHYASGVVDAATRPARTDAPAHGELELKVYDVTALAETRIPTSSGPIQVLAAGRYGYPGPVIRLIQPGVDVNYWDYQLRIDFHGLTLEALGSYDSLNIDTAVVTGRPQQGAAAQFLTTFHRVQLRDRYRRGPLELEAAIVGGLDRMTIFGGQGVQKLSLGGRAQAHIKLPHLTISTGIDAELSRFSAEQFETDQTGAAPDQLGELSGNRDGIVGGAFLQGTFVLDDWFGRPARITAGARVDVYHAAPVTLLGVDPRVVFNYQPLKQLEFFGGFGLYQQPPSFPVPLPGIDTFALQLGLQRSWQGSVGMRFKLPEDLSLSVTGYYGRFENMNDMVIDFMAAACTSAPPESLSGIPAYITRQVGGAGYGMELLARRHAGRVTGWLAYTLSRSERVFSCGLGPSDFDQTHVLNAVLQIRLPWRLMVGGRLNFSTGRPYTQLTADIANGTFSGERNNARLPTYVQLDLRVDREWIFQRWALSLFVEALNLTYSETVFGVTYPKDPTLMVTRYDQPQFNGFHWILPSIGARGRF